jgi:hypothetical protein
MKKYDGILRQIVNQGMRLRPVAACLMFMLAGLMWTAPVLAQDYPPPPPPKKEEPVITDVKPLSNRPQADRLPLEVKPAQAVSPNTSGAKPPTDPPDGGKPGKSGGNFSIKRNLPPPGARVIHVKVPERKSEANKTVLGVQPGVASQKSEKSEKLVPMQTNTQNREHRGNIREVTSSIQETPNGPQGSLRISGDFTPKNALPPSEGDRNSRALAIARAFLEEEAALLGIKNMDELRIRWSHTSKVYGGEATNIYYDRYIHDIKLDLSTIHITIGPSETIRYVNASLVPAPPELYQAATREMLKEDKIREIVEPNLKSAKFDVKNIKIAQVDKVAVPKPPYVIWKVLAGSTVGRGAWEFLIDAFTGEVLEKRDAMWDVK